jgi:hypothetical protein
MRKAILCVVILILFASPAFAVYKEMENVAGVCQGMKVDYKIDSQWSDYDLVTFRVTNASGATAYNVSLTVNVYDYFGKYVERLRVRGRGALLDKYQISAERKTIKMPKMAAEINCYIRR